MASKVNKNNLDLNLLKELVALIKESDLSEIEIKHTDKSTESIYVKVSRAHSNIFPTVPDVRNSIPPVEPVREPNIDIKEPSTNINLETHPGILLSPMVGTVYLAPEPGAEPFAKIGDQVEVGQTVLIVEAMKTLNQIPATRAGTIKRVLIDDGTPVEFGSPLMIIE